MDHLFLPAVVTFTSLTAYALGTWALRPAHGRLRGALLEACELLGIGLIFYLANLALGLVVVLGIRGLTPAFISAYHLADFSLPILSALEGLVFGLWRRPW